MIASVLVACSGRSDLGDVVILGGLDASASRDASTLEDTSTLPEPPPVRPRAACFPGAVSETPNVTCSASPSSGGASDCTARLSCSEGKVISMHCSGGTCRCDNQPYNTCYCKVTDPSDPCGARNCCWD